MILMNDVLVVERSRITDRLQVFATYRWGGPKPSNELRRRGPPSGRSLGPSAVTPAGMDGQGRTERERKKDFRSPVLLQCIKMPTDRSWCVGDPCGPGPSPAGKCFLFFFGFCSSPPPAAPPPLPVGRVRPPTTVPPVPHSLPLLHVHGDVVPGLLPYVRPPPGPRHGPLDELALVAPAA